MIMFLVTATDSCYPSYRDAACSGRCDRAVSQALAKGRFPSPSGFRREPPVPRLRGEASRRVLTVLVFSSAFALHLHRCRSPDPLPFSEAAPCPMGRFFCRFSRDRGSPFAFSARRRPSCQGDSLRRVWNCSARRRQTSSSDYIARCRNQVLSTQLSATVCTGPSDRTVLRVPWRSDMSFRFKGSGFHRFLPL